MANNSLFDVLGLPKSMDAALELAEGAIKVASSSAQEVAAVSVETIKEVSGKGLDMDGSLVGFQEGKAKSQELVEKDKTASDLRRKRMFFSSLTESLRNAQNYAHTPEIDELTVEAATMATEARNRLYGVQEGLKREYTSTAHGIAWTRRKILENKSKQQESEKSALIPSPAKKDMTFNLEDIEGVSSVSSGGAAAGKQG